MSRRNRSKRAAEAAQKRALTQRDPAEIVPDGVVQVPEGFSALPADVVSARRAAYVATQIHHASVKEQILASMPPASVVPAPAPVGAGVVAAREESQVPAWATGTPMDETAPRAAQTERKMAEKRVWFEGVPMSELAELAKVYPRVALKISRFDSQKGLSTLYARAMFEPAEIATIESWLMMQAGGGSFPITVSDPSDPLREICTGFVVKVEGQVRAPMPLDEAHADPNAPAFPPEWDAQRDRAAYTPREALSGPPRYASNGYPGSRGYGQGGAERPAPGATMASDAVLQRELQEAKTRADRLENEIKRLAADAEARNRLAEKQLADERQRAAEARHAADMVRLEDKFNAALALANAPKKDDGAQWLRTLEVLAPFLLAYMKESGGSQNRLLEAMILKGQGSDPFADLARIEPLITKLAGGRAGKDESALISKMTEGQLQNVMLMAELVKGFAEEKLPEDSPGMKILQQVLTSAAGMGEAYFKQKAEEAEREAQEKQMIAQRERNKAMEAEAASRRAREVVSQPPANASPQPSSSATQRAPSAPTPAGVPAELAAQFAMLPPSFQTPQWKKLLTELHTEEKGSPKYAPEEIGGYLAHYLEHLVMFGELPAELSGLLTEPQKTIDFVFSIMPVARKHPDYAKKVGAVVAQVFSRHAAAPATPPAPAAVVTPAPASNGHAEEEEAEDAEVVDASDADADEVRYPQ